MMENDKKYKEWLASYAKKYWWVFLLISLLTAFSVGLALLSPVPLKLLVDSVFGDQQPYIFSELSRERLLFAVVVIYFVIHILQNLFEGARALIEQRLYQMIDAAVVLDSFQPILGVPYNSSARDNNGSYLFKALEQSQNLSLLLFANFSSFFRSLLIIGGVIFVLVAIDWRLALVALISMPLLVFIVKHYNSKIETRSADAQAAESYVYESSSQILEKIKTIQEFSRERFHLNQIKSNIMNKNVKNRKLLVTNVLFSVSTEATIYSALSIAFLVGGYMVFGGSITLGDLLLFVNYVNIISDPLSSIAGTFGLIREQSTALRQVRSAIDDSRILNLSSGVVCNVAIKGRVRFDEVSYSVDDKVIADNITVEFPPGTVSVITGPSGEGKSTLLSMLTRFTSPISGSVKIDESIVADYNLEFLRQQVGVVDQEPELFSGTVEENIAYANPERQLRFPDVMAAGEASNSEEFISKLSDKYHTIVDESSLSGGQKQRIAIARVHYAGTPIIVMDEPTSALDSYSSQIFALNLKKYFKDKTIIIVTHDVSLIKQFERIFVLDSGKLMPLEELGGVAQLKKVLTSK